MAELKLLCDSKPPSRFADWMVRSGEAVVYVLVGIDKFGSGVDSHWVQLIREIGAGDWFRYFTGGVEVLGGLLALIPRTALLGLLLLIATMVGAVIILCFLGHAAESIFPGILLVALIAIALNRWSVVQG